MSHDAFREKLLDLAYGELPPRDARRLEAHAEGCAECRAELARIQETRRLMAALPQEPAPERGERILLAAAREAAGRRKARWRIPSWLLAASVVATSIVAVGTVSWRIASMRPGPLERSDSTALLGAPAAPEPGRAESPSAAEPRSPEDEAEASTLAGAPPALGSEAAPAAPAPARKGARPQPALRARPTEEAPVEAERFARAPAPPAPRAAAAEEAEAGFGLAGRIAEAPTPSVASEAKAEAARPSMSLDAPVAAAPTPRAPSRSLAPTSRREEARPGAASAAAAAPERADARARAAELRDADGLRAEIRTFPGCEGESWRKVETDPAGRVVRYVREGRIDGRRLRIEQVFDRDGALARVEVRDLDRPEARIEADALGIRLPERAEEARPDAPPRCDR